MKVYCRTNLDLHGESWPTELPDVPRVGELVQSTKIWKEFFQLKLKVVQVTWKQEARYTGIADKNTWYPEIELHIANGLSIREFYNWYAPLVGKSVQSFI